MSKLVEEIKKTIESGMDMVFEPTLMDGAVMLRVYASVGDQNFSRQALLRRDVDENFYANSVAECRAHAEAWLAETYRNKAEASKRVREALDLSRHEKKNEV